MRARDLLCGFGVVTALLLRSALGADEAPRPTSSVLIVDGMNNHDWPRATRILKSILQESGRFRVDVTTSPPAGAPAEQWNAWKPDFARYDVVVMNFNGGHTSRGVHWPRDLEKALEDYVSGGGGLVSYHAANNSFPNWPAYNQMIGLGWRDKNFGPSLVVSEDGKVVEIPKGQGLNPGHGPEHDFVVTVLDADHPITRGMPRTWLHPHEQLTHGQHGPAKDMTVLTYAYSKDSKQNEVMDWVVPYGKGRVYTTMLGHLWKNGPDTAMRCVGFQTMLIRGVEWAATGNVTYPVPDDFPTPSQIKLRSSDEAAAPEPPQGFQAVFNGRDLTGWEGSPKYWSVEDGCLTGKADGTLRFNRFITWRGGTVKNFELRVKVKVSPGGNSGLQYRGTERPDLGESVVTGYQCDVVANRPDYNGMLYEERGRRILAHTGEKVIIDPQGQPWAVGQFPLKEFKPGAWHEYRVLAEGNHQRHWIDGHPTVDVIDLDEKGRKLEGVLAVQVHVGPPMTIQYRDFFLKVLPDDLPLLTREDAANPPDARKVAPQGQDQPRKPDAD
jgi:type 1 glutamine amidotransferase